MPTSRSAIKRVRTSRERHERNMHYRSTLRTALRKVRQAPDRAAAEANLARAISLLDRFARRGLIHKNTAARHKSRLHHFVRSLGGVAQPPG